jgi:outer membrane protein OmpA-like peptidoglycan-associated protein
MNRQLSLIAIVCLTLGSAACVRSQVVTVEAADRDGDDVPDEADRCADASEDGLPPKVDDGCPQPDLDGDGIVGLADRCPNLAESKNGLADGDGCPESSSSFERKPHAVLTATEIKIDQKVMFAVNDSAISPLSTQLLDDIASLLKSNPDLELVEVAGHADRTGALRLNLELTRRRAESVVAALVSRGVDARRLRPVGYGPHCPVAPGDDDTSKEANRRVEFLVVTRNGKPTNVNVGCPAAVAAGIKSRS